MIDILSSIQNNEPLHLQGKTPLSKPYGKEEERVVEHLEKLERLLDWSTADALRCAISALIFEERDQAFSSGAHFGARVVAELLSGV